MKISFDYNNKNLESQENFKNFKESHKEEIEINSDSPKNNFSFYKSKGTVLSEEKKLEMNTDDNKNIKNKIIDKIQYDNPNTRIESNNNNIFNHIYWNGNNVQIEKTTAENIPEKSEIAIIKNNNSLDSNRYKSPSKNNSIQNKQENLKKINIKQFNKNEKEEWNFKEELFTSINKRNRVNQIQINDLKNESIINLADNISSKFKISKEIEKENINPNKNSTVITKEIKCLKLENNNNSITRSFNNSNFSKEKVIELECFTKSSNSSDNSKNFSASNKDKKSNLNNKKEKLKCLEEENSPTKNKEYVKEMKELYKLFKKNLLKIKFEKFPNTENCNKKHLNLKYPERQIFDTLIKENIPEEEWYDFIYEEILNYNCLQSIYKDENTPIKNDKKVYQKKSKLEDTFL